METFKHGTSSAYSYRKCRCLECVAWKKQASREYYERNAEKVRARNSGYARENRGKINERVRATRAADPEKRREYERQRFAADPERAYQKQRAWEQRNPWRAWFHRWCKRNRRAGEVYAVEVLEWIKTLVDPTCTYCGAPAETIDHVIPRSKGGTNDRANLTPTCHQCNRIKRNLSVEDFLRRLARRNGD